MPRAWLLVGITVFVGAFALATGLPMFYRALYAFGLLLVLSALWTWLLVRGIEVEVRRPILRTRVGSELSEKVVVRRRSRFLHGLVELQESTDMPAPAPGAVVSLGEGEEMTLDLRLPCPRRGLFRLGPLRVTGSDPFGLYLLKRSAGPAQPVIVHPATVPLPSFRVLPADLPGEAARHRRSQNVTTNAYGVRDYVFGDSLNRISWKSTAHHDRLMVKEFEIEPANNTWVLLDMERRAHTGFGDEGTEETAVSLAASVAKLILDANLPVGFMSHGNERVIIPAQRGAGQLLLVLDALAALRAQGNVPLAELITDLHTKAGRYTSVIIVTPSAQPEWLDGARRLLEHKAMVALLAVDGDLTRETYPESAYAAAGMGIAVYAVKRGALASTGLVFLSPSGRHAEPRPVVAPAR